jgi:hypothetical protein
MSKRGGNQSFESANRLTEYMTNAVNQTVTATDPHDSVTFERVMF